MTNVLMLGCLIFSKQSKSDEQRNTIPVDFAIAPINTAGTAINMHPNAAVMDRICARCDDFEDKTRWK